jgi:alpha-tubulin suppressor-like RCC1 family protein
MGWGDDFQGQLGNGSNDDSATAVAVTGLTGRVVAIAAGKAHSLAVKSDGSVWAWGNNGSHALGTETADVFQNTPLPVEGLSRGVAAAAGCLNQSGRKLLSLTGRRVRKQCHLAARGEGLP